MDSTISARFADACGATARLDLVVERDGDGVVAQGTFDQPFAVLGRDPTCDICLPDADVSPRHAFLQVVGGQVFVADLGSKTGIDWPAGRRPYGWLTVDEPIRIGRYRIYLQQPVSVHPYAFGPSFHPMAAGPDLPGGLPLVEVEFRNGRSQRSFWNVNRVITLIGRAKECKIHLSGDDVSHFHCYLMLTADGLWAIDLFGRGGVRVNGEVVRCRRLNHNDEVKIGRFVLGCVYTADAGDNSFVSFELPKVSRPAAPEPDDSADNTDAVGSGHPTAGKPDPATGLGPLVQPAAPTNRALLVGLLDTGKTEPDLELVPAFPGLLDSAPADMPLFADLPGYTASEIDLPPQPTAAETTGEPESWVSPPLPLGEGPGEGLLREADLTPQPPSLEGKGEPESVPPLGKEPEEELLLPTMQLIPVRPLSAEAGVVPMLQQLGEMQGQMFAQFQQSLMMMASMFGQMQSEQSDAMRQQMARMAELNQELVKLQVEMMRPKPEPEPPPAAPVRPLPDPEALPAVSAESADLHNRVWEKMNALNSERQTVWKKISAMMSKLGG